MAAVSECRSNAERTRNTDSQRLPLQTPTLRERRYKKEPDAHCSGGLRPPANEEDAAIRDYPYSLLMRQRLKRLDIIYQHFPIYFVTACTAKRQPLLATETVHRTFKAFGASGPTHGAWIGAYVFMPDHFHLFVAIDDQKLNLSVWAKSLKGTLGSAFRAQENCALSWQKGFFDHVLRSGESYSQKWHYVRENPVRAKLVSRWEEWPYLGEIFDLQFHEARL